MIYTQLIRYLIGGGSVFLVSIALLYMFVDVFGIWYLWATTATFIICVGLSFTVQKYWTFRDHSTDALKGQMGVYIFLQLINLGANAGLMYVAVDLMGIQHLVAQVFTTGLIAVWSFIAYRYLFSKRLTHQTHDQSLDHTSNI